MFLETIISTHFESTIKSLVYNAAHIKSQRSPIKFNEIAIVYE